MQLIVLVMLEKVHSISAMHILQVKIILKQDPIYKDGFPDFSSVSTHTVKIELTGNRALDDAAANRVAGLDAKPRGFTWHHHQDGTTMQLVPTDIHRKTGHTGGFALGG